MTDTTGDNGFHQALDRMHKAFAKVANGDVSEVMGLHSHADDATSFYGWGGYEKGWDKVSRRWEWAGTQFLGGTVSYETISTVVSGDLAYAVEIETYVAKRPGVAAPVTWSNRLTQIFRRENGAWRMVHRHANKLEPNPVPVKEPA